MCIRDIFDLNSYARESLKTATARHSDLVDAVHLESQPLHNWPDILLFWMFQILLSAFHGDSLQLDAHADTI